MRNPHDEIIDSVLSGLQETLKQATPESQEYDSYSFFSQKILTILRLHPYELKLGSNPDKLYSPREQEKIVDELKAIREALVSEKFHEKILCAFDNAQNKLLDEYKIGQRPAPKSVEQKEPIKEAKLLWKKTGNFQAIFSSGGPLNRMVKYTGHDSKQIQTITLLGYQDGDVAIKLEIKEIEYRNIITIIERHNLPKPSFINEACNDYSTVIQDIGFLNYFLAAIIEAEDSARELEDEIRDTITPFIKKNNSFSGWVKSGSFQPTISNPAIPLNRHVVYKSVISENFKAITLFGYTDKQIKLRLEMTHKHAYDAIVNPLIEELKLPPSNNLDRECASLLVTIKDTKHLITIFEIIQKKEPTVSRIIADLVNEHNPEYSKAQRLALLCGLLAPKPGSGELPSPIFTAFKDCSQIADSKIFSNIFSFVAPLPHKNPAAGSSPTSAKSSFKKFFT